MTAWTRSHPRRATLVLLTTLALGSTLVACRAQVASPARDPAPAERDTAATATLRMVRNNVLGDHLADGDGYTVYVLLSDSPNQSMCVGECAETWQPVTTVGAPMVESGVDPALIATFQRDDGTTQVSYNGWPLYFFGLDAGPGETSGQGLGDTSYAISAAGQLLIEE